MTTTTNLKSKLSDFGTSLSQLQEDNRNDKEIEQNHFGDFLMIQEPEVWCKTHNYKVWLNHPDNVRQGESKWLIEYAGKANGFRWETIAEGNY